MPVVEGGSRRGRLPAWAWLVMLIQAVVLVIAVPRALSDGPTAPSARADPEQTTVATPDPVPEPIADPVRVLIIGDSYSVGSAEGGVGAGNWTNLAAEQLDAATVDVRAEGGRGYVSTGPAGGTFLDLVERADEQYDVVLVFGSRNDDEPRAEVRRGADQVFAAIRAASPEAELVVVGPPWVDGSPPQYVVDGNQAVSRAAAAAEATYVDPLAEGWFTGSARRLIGRDGIHPTDEGHDYLAEQILPSLRAAVQRARR